MIPPESFRNACEAEAFSISVYQPVMYNHPKVFSRVILEPNLGQKSRVTALCSAIPNSNIYFLLNDCFHAVIFSQLGPHYLPNANLKPLTVQLTTIIAII